MLAEYQGNCCKDRKHTKINTQNINIDKTCVMPNIEVIVGIGATQRASRSLGEINRESRGQGVGSRGKGKAIRLKKAITRAVSSVFGGADCVEYEEYRGKTEYYQIGQR